MFFVVLLVASAVGIGLLCGRNIAQTLPLCATAIIICLFLFYCANQLIVGYFLLVGCGIFLSCLIIYYFTKSVFKTSPKTAVVETLKPILTPSSLVLALMALMVFFATRYSSVILCDETRLWGALPKILFYTPKLQLGKSALLIPAMQPYFPGAPLFGWFVSRFALGFVDWRLFFAYGLLCILLLAPAISKLEKKHLFAAVPLAAVLFFTPLFFYGGNLTDNATFYSTLFTDPLVGIFAAYCFFLACLHPFKDVFSCVRFALALSAAILIKDSSVIFSISAFAVAVISELSRTSFKNLWIKITSCAALPVVCFCLWKWVLLINGIGLSPKNIAFSNISWQDFKEYFTVTATVPVILSKIQFISLSFSALAIFLLLFVALLLIAKQSYYQLEMRLSALFLTVANICFWVGLFVMYRGVHSGEIVSFERYISSALLASTAFVIMTLTDQFLKNKLHLGTFGKTIICTVLVLAVLCFPVQNTPVLLSWQGTAPTAQKAILHLISQDTELLPQKPIKVAMLVAKQQPLQENEDYFLNAVGFGQQVYYGLIGSGVWIQYFCVTQDFTVQTITSYSAQMDADYLFIYSLDCRWSAAELTELNKLTGIITKPLTLYKIVDDTFVPVINNLL